MRAPRVGPAQQAAGLAAHSLADRVPPVARHARFAAVHVQAIRVAGHAQQAARRVYGPVVALIRAEAGLLELVP